MLSIAHLLSLFAEKPKSAMCLLHLSKTPTHVRSTFSMLWLAVVLRNVLDPERCVPPAPEQDAHTCVLHCPQ